MSDYEPPKEECDALANEFLAAYKRAPSYGEVARFVLRRQHERESGLLEALRSIERMNYIGTPGRVCRRCWKRLKRPSRIAAIPTGARFTAWLSPWERGWP